jgi:hypothetical protein
MNPRKRSVERGTYEVGVDDKDVSVEGKKVTKTKKNKTVVKFKAKGSGEGNPIKRISDKVVKKDGVVKKDRKKTTY